MFIGGMECTLAEFMDDTMEGVVNKLEGSAGKGSASSEWAEGSSEASTRTGEVQTLHYQLETGWLGAPLSKETLRIPVSSELNMDQPRVCGLYPAVLIQHERLTNWRPQQSATKLRGNLEYLAHEERLRNTSV